jgi:alkylhydroperoxidase family enzyme
MEYCMAKWEQREAAREQSQRQQKVAELRERMNADDSKVRKREAERVAEQAVRKGTGMAPRE